MRLTLRTLLAYLEDELKPSESKEIGQKIAASPVATSLAQRIREVMRRRRLSAEDLNESGLDANIVAEYLDGSLSAQEVADVEKVCLGSDAHLAEVAACHQILTLVLGEPVEISESSRERMYALADDGTAGKFEGPSAPQEQGVPAAAEPTPFPVHLMRKPWWKQAFPILVPAVLIGLWVIIIVFFAPSLNPFAPSGEQGNSKIQITTVDDEPDHGEEIPAVVPRQGEEPTISTVAENTAVPDRGIDPEPPPDMPEQGDQTAKQSVAVAEKGDETESAIPPKPTEVKPTTPADGTSAAPIKPADPETPAAIQQVAGRYQSSEGVLLSFDVNRNGWFTVPYELKLLAGTEVIVPQPFSAIVKLEQSAPLLTLEGGTHAKFITDSPAATEGLKLEEGRVLLEAVDADTTPYAIQAGELNWRVELIGANSRVGLEMEPHPVFGFEQPLPKNHFSLKLMVARGAARVANSQGQSVMINENQQVVLQNPPADAPAPSDPAAPPDPQPEPGHLSDTLLQPIGLLPEWMQHPKPQLSTIQRRYRNDFASQFDPVLGTSENMEPLIEDDRPQMAEYAVSCLGLIGDYRGLITTLRVSEFEATRLEALHRLRLWLPRHFESRQELLSELELAFPNDDDAAVIDRLLWGYTRDDARDAVISQELMSWVEHPRPVIRELAFMEMARLTDFEYGYRALVSPSQRRSAILRWERAIREEGALLPANEEGAVP